MRAITLTQPWATLVALGEKTIETRSWSTSYRGPIAIHAAKGFPKDAWMLCMEEPFFEVLTKTHHLWATNLPRGEVIATAYLRDCISTTSDACKFAIERGSPHESAFGDYSPGRFGLLLDSVRRLTKTIPFRGMLGLWEFPDTYLREQDESR